MSGMERMLDLLADLSAVRDRVPTYRWGTVTGVSPLTVLLDGPGETVLPYSPVALVPVHAGDRVRVRHLRGVHEITGAKRPPASTPWASAAGSVTITGNGTIDASTTATFPTGRFTVPPLVTFGVGNINYNVSFANLTAAGMTVHVRRMDYATFTDSIPVHWRAAQMTPTSAGG